MTKRTLLLVSLGLLLMLNACAPQAHWVDVTLQAAGQPSLTPSPSAVFTQTAAATSSPIFTPTEIDTPTPTPTATLLPGVTPTWFNRYQEGFGASDDEARVMDAALMKFKKAAVSGDMYTIADMLEYPLWTIVDSDWVWVANKQDFFNLYDREFTQHFREVMANFDFNGDYLFVSYHGFFIMHYDDFSDTEVLFDGRLNGKITRIIYSEFHPDEVTFVAPTITPTRTFTATPIGGINAYRSPTPTPTPYWFPTTQPNLNDVKSYFGTWVITRYESTGKDYCQGDENYASDEVGHKVEFLPDSLRFPAEFLNINKDMLYHIVYQWLDQETYDYKYGNSLPDTYPDKMKNPLYLGVIIDRMGIELKAEVTRSGRLVINDSCYFFFLDKVPPEQKK